MPRGIPTSTIAKPVLVQTLCDIISTDINTVYNPSNGTLTKELLQAVCTFCQLPNNLSKIESASSLCKTLNLNCTNIDFNSVDGTISAGFIEKVINSIK